MTAYNFFFKEERQKLLQEKRKTFKPTKKANGRVKHGVGFALMAKTIAKRWKQLGPEERAKYDELADQSLKQQKEKMRKYKAQVSLLRTMPKEAGK